MPPTPDAELTLPGPYIDPWSAAFRSRELEDRYRRNFLNRDAWRVVLVVLLANTSNLTFIRSDIEFAGDTSGLQPLLGLRVLFLGMSLVLLGILWRSASPKLVDASVFTWTLYLCLLSLIIATTRPPDYAPRVILDAFVVLIIYLLIPNRFWLQLLPAAVLTVGSVQYVLFDMTLSGPAMRATLAIFIFANIFGAWTAWQSHMDRRRQYALLVQERELREALERAREERKILEGLLPICASCKSVRDDAGYWRKVEQFLVDETDLDITHGICPDCADTLYPEYQEPDPKVI